MENKANDTRAAIERPSNEPARRDAPAVPRTAVDWRAAADYWRAKYDEERERLAKLWVAYRDLEDELGRPTEADAPPEKSVTLVPSEPQKTAKPTNPPSG